jgi:hypothetical protein
MPLEHPLETIQILNVMTDLAAAHRDWSWRDAPTQSRVTRLDPLWRYVIA